MEGEIDHEVLMSVKEEPLMISVEDEKGGGGWAAEVEAAPFLRKTFEMVDDVETDSIVSWSRTRPSFIVWDPHKLCALLLPKLFKHSNFSSFVRQLNTYGFRKIDPDRWEFANEGFQQGKKHLLRHIKRRKKSTSNRIEGELLKLRDDQSELRVQLMSLRRQQQDALHRLADAHKRLHVTETKQKHLLVFLIKTLKNPMLMIDTMKKRRKRKLEDMTIQESSSNFDVLTENFVLWEKLMEDDMIYEEDVKKQCDIVSELESLIAKTPPADMVELVA